MSLILEALRKSEAERRRGQSPDLYGAAPLAASSKREGFRQWPVVAGGLLVLVAVAMLFWPQSRQATSGAESQASESADAAAVDTTAAIPHKGEVPSPASRAPTYPSSGDTAASIAVEPALVSTQAPLAPPAPPPPAHRTAAETMASPGNAASSPLNASAARLPPAPPPPPVSITPAAPPSPQVETLPSLASLSAGQRAALPPLKLSVHVWNSDPAQRFAIVDGQRVVEGAALGNAVVAEIRRDGIVLDVNGQRVLLPRP